MIIPPAASSRRRPPPPLVLWILWIALVGSIAVYQSVLGGGIPRGHNEGVAGWSLPVVLAAIQLGVAALIRWIVIPKVTDPVRLLPLMIAGLALSEAVVFYGIFLIAPEMPQTRLEFFLASFLSALQFAPFYARSRAQEGFSGSRPG